MKHFSLENLNHLSGRYRAQFINSITGAKSANLIGTIAEDGQTNLAIFSSVVHIGSKPPLLGFVLRPTTVERHTYHNIKANSKFTLNHIHTDMIDKAHQTSAKYGREISEFDAVGLEEEYLKDCKAPFVKSSRIKIACQYKNEYLIEENGCRLVIGEITDVYFDENFQAHDGFLDISKSESIGILGSDAYVKMTMLNRFEYAEPGKQLEVKE